tara:strand:- start:1370 stop:1627 length:258 start_codon:yes stop_codon:yes gene_type:complete
MKLDITENPNCLEVLKQFVGEPVAVRKRQPINFFMAAIEMEITNVHGTFKVFPGDYVLVTKHDAWPVSSQYFKQYYDVVWERHEN